MNLNRQSEIGNLKHYSFLVKQAWEAYQAGNTAEMANLLEKSLNFSPYLRAETVSDWVSRFAQFYSDFRQEFDSDLLSNVQEWQNAVSNTLEIRLPGRQENKNESDNSIKVPFKIENKPARLEEEKKPNNDFSETQFRKEVRNTIKTDGVDGIYLLIHKYLAQDIVDQFKLNSLIFSEIKDSHTEESIQFGEKAFKLSGNTGIAKVLSVRYRKLGDLYRACELLEYVKNKTGEEQALIFLRGQIYFLEQGFPLPERKNKFISLSRNNLKVHYLLHNSLPYNSGGYATRAHGLSVAICQHNIQLEPVTRLGYPLDIKNQEIHQAPEYDMIDDVTYYRLLTHENGFGQLPLNQYLAEYSQALVNFAKVHQPDILHGASNFMNGVAVNYAARVLGLPSIYEVRGLWEVTRMSRQPCYEDSDLFNMMKRMETEAAVNATAVITITEALRDEMVRRGVPRDKITVIPNGVDSDRFKPLERDRELEESLGYQNKVVIGYVGSVVQYEGLDYLIKAASILKEKGLNNFTVLIVGDGDCLDAIQQLSEQLNVQDITMFTGRVPHHEVEKYYSLIDITPYPRKGQPVCEMVSPMKPFEAMSMSKCVVSSNVAALTEIVNDGVTGLLHQKDSSEDLANILEKLICNQAWRQKLGEEARIWVKGQRDWKFLAKKLISVYRKVV
jgi:glycosyltransferase involved in cell wall biosynthesis